jgi:hypothetical protein
MPYVTPKDRQRLDAGEFPRNAGELNYAITQLCRTYLQGQAYDHTTLTQGPTRYAHLNEVVGVLECAKLEFYRRAAAPYEDTKIKENGDVS